MCYMDQISQPFLISSSVAEKTCLCQEVILADGDILIIDDHCRCREVYGEAAVSGGLTVITFEITFASSVHLRVNV